jgi:hypothetical protein
MHHTLSQTEANHENNHLAERWHAHADLAEAILQFHQRAIPSQGLQFALSDAQAHLMGIVAAELGEPDADFTAAHLQRVGLVALMRQFAAQSKP